jgi:hypothetical protein
VWRGFVEKNGVGMFCLEGVGMAGCGITEVHVGMLGLPLREVMVKQGAEVR